MKISYNSNPFKFKPKKKRKTSLLQLVYGESGSLNQSGYINAV